MTSYTIIVSCPELSFSDTLFTFDLPEIKIDDVVKNAEIVEVIYKQLTNLNIPSAKSSLLSLLETLV